MTVARRWAGAVVVGPLVFAACLSPNLAPATLPEPMLVMRVRNENLADVRVYALRETFEYRLGIVTTFRTEYFRVPTLFYRSAGRLRIKVVPIGGGPAYVTDPILTNGIHRVDLHLANPFALSAIFVR